MCGTVQEIDASGLSGFDGTIFEFRNAAPKSADVGVLLSNGPGKFA